MTQSGLKYWKRRDYGTRVTEWRGYGGHVTRL